MSPDDQHALITFANPVWLIWAVNTGVQLSLNTPERLVLERIAMHVRKEHEVGDTAYCWPHLATIADLTGLSMRAVHRAIRKFKTLGILERKHYRDSFGGHRARALCLHREPREEPATSGRLSRPRAEPERATSGTSRVPHVAPANCHQRQLHIENTIEDTNLKTETRAPPAPNRGGDAHEASHGDQNPNPTIRARFEATRWPSARSAP